MIRVHELVLKLIRDRAKIFACIADIISTPTFKIIPKPMKSGEYQSGHCHCISIHIPNHMSIPNHISSLIHIP